MQRLQALPARTKGNAPERLRTERSSRRAQRTVRTHRGRRGRRAVRHPASRRDGHLRTGAECGAPTNLPVPAERNGPGTRPGTRRVKRPRRRRRHVASEGRPRPARATSENSRLPVAPEANPEQSQELRRPGTKRAGAPPNSPHGTEKYPSWYRQPDPAPSRQPPTASSTTSNRS